MAREPFVASPLVRLSEKISAGGGVFTCSVTPQWGGDDVAKVELAKRKVRVLLIGFWGCWVIVRSHMMHWGGDPRKTGDVLSSMFSLL